MGQEAKAPTIQKTADIYVARHSICLIGTVADDLIIVCGNQQHINEFKNLLELLR